MILGGTEEVRETRMRRPRRKRKGKKQTTRRTKRKKIEEEEEEMEGQSSLSLLTISLTFKNGLCMYVGRWIPSYFCPVVWKQPVMQDIVR